MAYDQALEARLDDLVGQWQLTKKRMFGGLAYLDEGAICFAIMKDELLIKVVPAERHAKLLQQDGIRQATMGARTMTNWVLADGEALADEAELIKLLRVGRESAEQSRGN